MKHLGVHLVQASLLSFVLIFAPLGKSMAQAESDSSMDEIESLFNEEAKKKEQEKTDGSTSGTETPENEEKRAPLPEIKSISNLKLLEPFEDVAVIQKKYLSKTRRLEAYIGPAMTLNDPFFYNIGFMGRASFYFIEKLGVEVNYLNLSTSQRPVTADLLNKGVLTESFVISKSFLGADLKWAPIYGKFSLSNKKIVHFDMYFSAGAGKTSTNQAQSPATLHLGTGQIFAVTRNIAFRWDLSWNTYYSETANQPKQLVDNVYLTMGASFFFPGAKTR